jgi:hypothetical protein
VIPIQTIVLLITLRLFSVEFQATGDVRDILYPMHSYDAAATPPAEVLRRPPVRIRLWQLFDGINQPRSFEGYALQAGILLMAMFLTWMFVLPLLRSLFPGFDASRSGPRGFPVTVHIGPSILSFTNGSGALWTCRAELGPERLSGVFQVDAGKTIKVSFGRFDPNGNVDESRIRRAAQERISLTCDEPSGISHYADLY